MTPQPANFLVVEGQLKLIDFGIARTIQNDTTNIVRDSQASRGECVAGDAGEGHAGASVQCFSESPASQPPMR